ncbi:hypothetical protein [Nocardia farcinica]|uniref:hypothetical protein n=1 Tax=Nocardia farcinica TaxID=37329 RepID=UPI0024552724|nr:hypothetical protein [Nocardia farcinica]
MTTPNLVPDGVLTITGDGTASWWSPEPAVVAAVEVSVGRGAVVEVDAAYPDRVLSWVLTPDGDVDALAAAFGDPTLAEHVAAATAGGETVTVTPAPQLVGPWIRRALVAAVQRWALRPVDESALMLDEAASHYRTGNMPAATRLFALASPALMALGQQCLDGQLAGGPAEELREITQAAGQAVADTAWGGNILSLAASLQSQTAIDDDALAAALREWDLEDVSFGGAVHMGADTFEFSGVSVDSAQIDPSTIPPRILDWRGAEEHELFLEYQAAADQVTISATLAIDVDPLCLETQQLFAYGADRATGEVVAVAPMQVRGHRVEAQLACRGYSPSALHIGLYYAGTELDALRLDEVGQLLVTVDRWMLDAWNHQRTALAAIHAVPADADETLLDAAAQIHEDHLDLASTAADTASTTITDYLEHHPDAPPETVTALEVRREVIQRYLDDLEAISASRSPNMPALLAEMLPVEPWNDEDDQ